MNKLSQFLLGVKFVVYTDCQALMYLNNLRSTNSQVARWHDCLQEYDYEVKYRTGTQMSHVDALFSAPVAMNERDLDEELSGRYEVCTLMTEEDADVPDRRF